jgi:hypothetical protein
MHRLVVFQVLCFKLFCVEIFVQVASSVCIFGSGILVGRALKFIFYVGRRDVFKPARVDVSVLETDHLQHDAFSTNGPEYNVITSCVVPYFIYP